MMDPPDHTRYRKLVNRGFTPRMIGQLEPHIRDLTDMVLDKAVAKGAESGEIDFVVDIAAELPLEVIAELIGVPSDERHKIFDWSNRMVGSEDPEYMVSAEEVFNAQVEMFMYAQQLADKRRAEPTDDIITALLEADHAAELLLGGEGSRVAVADDHVGVLRDHPEAGAIRLGVLVHGGVGAQVGEPLVRDVLGELVSIEQVDVRELHGSTPP